MLDTESLEPWETCALCHGFDGNSAMAKFPKLAGQKPAYLRKQIKDFKAGLRANDGGQMVNMVSGLSSSDKDQIAAWFASQSHPQPSPPELYESLATEARKLFVKGSDTDDIPACISCHHSKDPLIPLLEGQHANYLRKQLNDFRDQIRTNDREVMQRIARSLSEKQIDLLAEYIASLSRQAVSFRE